MALGSSWLAQRFEWALYDRMTVVATANPVPPADVVVVAIDEPSFSELQMQWPWPRQVHASLIDALAAAGARTIVFDILFDTESDAGNDAALALAIQRAGNVILACGHTETEDRAYSIAQWVDPIPLLADAAAGVGGNTVVFDADGTIRRTALVYEDRPVLSYAAASRAGAGRSPRDLDRVRLIRFYGLPRQGVTTVSYYQVLQPGLLPPDMFRGKTVFVGRALSAAADLASADLYQTPVWPLTPGVEIHANIFAMLSTGREISDPFAALSSLLVLSLIAGVIGALAFYRFDAPVGLGLLVVAFLVMTPGAFFALSRWDTRVPVVAPALAIAGVYVSTTAYRFALGRRERQMIKRAFQNYVSPVIVEQMLADPSRLKLGGEAYDLSIIFTDLVGFTTFAESLPAGEVQARLSVYFKAMMEELLKERGTLDKFIGDAILAYFGAPIVDANHPAQACRTALAMQRRLGELNREWRARHEPELHMRIGVNTGTAIAGNMGTDTIFNYTILGDAVNLASRLEALNKEHGTSILVGEDTRARVTDQFEWREIGSIRVKGKTQPVVVYELIGERAT